jgi:integrase
VASIEKRNGKYRVRFRDPTGRPRSKTFMRKADADRFAREVEVDKDRGSWIDPRKSEISLQAWAEAFLASSLSLSPTSLATYRRDLERYVLPALGDRWLSRLNAEEIEQWLAAELARGVSPSSVHRHYRTLRRVLQAAVEKDRLLINPCTKIRPPRVPARPMAILTWAQSVALAEAHPEHLRPMIYLALDSGMRWSELVGLRRGQVDLARRKVRVTEQLLRIGDEWVRRPTKAAAGVRSITVSSSTAEMLERHLAGQPNGEDELVFTTTAGTPLQHASFQTHAWKKALAATGVKCRFHDLRHTSVALAIASGAHPKAIQVRMGHSTITVTLDRYGHLFPELDEAIAVAFDQGWAEARAVAGFA